MTWVSVEGEGGPGGGEVHRCNQSVLFHVAGTEADQPSCHLSLAVLKASLKPIFVMSATGGASSH